MFVKELVCGGLQVSDPELIKHVNKTKTDVYIKGAKFHEDFKELLGNGIFNVVALGG